MALVALGLLHADGRTDGQAGRQKLMGGSRVLKFTLLILYACCMVSATLLTYRCLGDTKCALHTANGNWKISVASHSRCKEIGVCLGYEYHMVKRQISPYKLP
jgi:hypothetical protein